MLIWGGKHQLSAGTVLFPPNSPECHWNWARLELHQLFMGLTLWNGVKMVSSFSTPGKRRSCFVFLQGNVPSEPGTTLFFEKHLQPFLSPTEGTPKLEIRDPSTFSCSGITLGMAWDGWAGRDWQPLPSQSTVTLSPWGTQSESSTCRPWEGSQEEWLC